MPDNENPFPVDNPMHDIYKNGSEELRAALYAEWRKTNLPHESAEYVLPTVVPSPPSEEDEYMPSAWGGDMEIDFVVPSGGKCRVRKVDIVDLLGDGLLNKLDSMTNIVSAQHIPNATATGKVPSKAAVNVTKELLGDEKKSAEFRNVIDKVLLRVVVRPQLWPVPPAGEGRVKGCVYVDSIPFTDRISIFNWAVTGKKEEEIAQFREGAEKPVGDMESGEGVQHTPVKSAQPE